MVFSPRLGALFWMTQSSLLARPFSSLPLSGMLLFMMTACSSEEAPGTNGTGGAVNSQSGGSTAGDGGTSSTGGANAGTGASAPGTGGSDPLGTGGGDPLGTGGATGTPKRTFVYMGSGDWGNASSGKITVFEMNRTTKELSLVSDHDAGGLASFLALDLNNLRLFSADENNGGVHAFTISPETGSLTPNGSATSPNKPVYLSLTPDGQYLFGANYGQGSIDVYPVDATGQVGASVQTENTGTNAHCIVMDGMSRVLVANKGSDTISRFTFAAGVLTPQSPATTALGSPRHITFGPDGRAYVVSESVDLITAFTVENDGQLSVYWQDKRLPAGGKPVEDTGADIRVTPNGKFVYATNRGTSNTIVAYDVSSGAQEFIEHEPTQGEIPRSMAMDPQGEFLLVGNRGDNKVSVFNIAADGSLDLALNTDVATNPYFVTVVEL